MAPSANRLVLRMGSLVIPLITFNAFFQFGILDWNNSYIYCFQHTFSIESRITFFFDSNFGFSIIFFNILI